MIHSLNRGNSALDGNTQTEASRAENEGTTPSILHHTVMDVVLLQQEQLSEIVSELHRKTGSSKETHAFTECVRETLFRHLYELLPIKNKICLTVKLDNGHAHAFVRTWPGGEQMGDPHEIKWMEKLYVELSQLAISYVVLHSATQITGHLQLSEMTLRHLAHIQNLVREARQLLPMLVTGALLSARPSSSAVRH